MELKVDFHLGPSQLQIHGTQKTKIHQVTREEMDWQTTMDINSHDVEHQSLICDQLLKLQQSFG